MLENYFSYDGALSSDYGVYITGSKTFGTPEREIESVDVPGRSGALTIDKKRFRNIEVVYPAFIREGFQESFPDFRAFLLSKPGYRVLRDTYNPNRYRKARILGPIEPDMGPGKRYPRGSFDLKFDCMPQWFLDEGNATLRVTSGSTINNPTYYDALPLIRVYGTGTVTVNGITVAVTSVLQSFTDLDCDAQDAYEGTANRNPYITLTNGKFPSLSPGDNAVGFTGFSRVEITPRFWTI